MKFFSAQAELVRFTGYIWKVSGSRHRLPETLPGATEFSEQPEMTDQLWVVRTLKQYPQWLNPLIQGTDLERNWGRPRHGGLWALAYLAFVVSGRSDVEPWWASTDDAFWAECGFSLKPCYQTVWNRFTELEQVWEAFDEATSLMIAHSRRKSDGRVGQDVHIDGTESETNARLHHDCRGRCGRYGTIGKRMHADEARTIRQREAAEPEPDDPSELNLGVGTELEDQRGYRRLKVGNCWFKTRDKSSGIRAYTRPGGRYTFWHGGNNIKVIDHFTGAPIAVRVVDASIQECVAYPDVKEAAIGNLGDTPRAVVADRGFSTKGVFEWNTRRGIASVIPFRENPQRTGRPDHDAYDRHGIPRCKHCGATTQYVRFADAPSPRVWFRCVDGTTAACGRFQSLACSHDWKALLPMWRDSEPYHALRNSHSNYERVHAHWRSRYRVAAATHEMRPKRVGLRWQQLRASAALLIDWLRIIHRHGWTGSARRNSARPKKTRADRIVNSFLGSRLAKGLLNPYGPKAVELGLGGLRPGQPPPGRGDPGPGRPRAGRALLEQSLDQIPPRAGSGRAWNRATSPEGLG